ncbi:MAG TPA: hotdog domain-containing protein [Acidimicrobiales bacterium]|jgi:predicted thioesterase|nr:hotdog domain-containing protein [Acidimicrobiales bacterium]
MPAKPGLTASVELTVSEADTAISFRSGNVPVLATPRVIALCEEASVLALDGCLPDGETSVGMRVQIDHVQPTAVGATVTAEATLEKIEGRRLTFTVHAHDTRGLIAAGRVTRVVVDVERFLEKAH